MSEGHEAKRDRTTRYVNSAVVSALVEIAHGAVMQAANAAALYDDELEGKLDAITDSLNNLR